MIDGGTGEQVVRAAAAAAQAPVAAPAQQGFAWTLVFIGGLALFFVVEVVRALPWRESVRDRVGGVVLIAGLAVVLTVALAQQGNVGVWIAAHVLPAGAIAILLLEVVARLRRP